jgi:nicotinamidase-related amidase
VLDLLAEGYNVYVVGDCVSSRKKYTRDTAVARMAGAGAIVTNAETALFELLGSASDPHFKAISKLVK